MRAIAAALVATFVGCDGGAESSLSDAGDDYDVRRIQLDARAEDQRDVVVLADAFDEAVDADATVDPRSSDPG